MKSIKKIFKNTPNSPNICFDVFEDEVDLLGDVFGLALEPEGVSLVGPLDEDLLAQLEPEGGRGHVLHQQLLLRKVFVGRNQIQRNAL